LPKERTAVGITPEQVPLLGKLRVYFIHDSSACGLYRAYLPCLSLRETGLAQALSYNDDLEACSHNPFLPPQVRQSRVYLEMQVERVRQSVQWADVVVFQRMGTDEGLRMARLAHSLGKPVVHESDDMCEAIESDNPAYWFWKQDRHIEPYRECFRMADLVTTTNERLAEFYQRSYGTRAVVLPNMLDYGAQRWMGIDYSKGPGVIVGWMGSESHFNDIEILRELVPWLLREFPQVSFEFCGFVPQWAVGLDRVCGKRGDIRKVPTMTAKWDIGLAPINDVPFNTTGKSDIKVWEYALADIVTLASDLPPYRGSLVHGSTGMLAKWNDVEDWKRKLRQLVTRPLLRQQLAANARDWVIKHRTSRGNVGLYFKTYGDLVLATRH